MTEEKPTRRPFGERDDEPRKPFGAWISRRGSRNAPPSPEDDPDFVPQRWEEGDPVPTPERPARVPWVRVSAELPEDEQVDPSDPTQQPGDGSPPTVDDSLPPDGPPSPSEPIALSDVRQVPLRFLVVLRTILVVVLAAAIVASLFTWWTPNTFLTDESMDQLSVALATQAGFGASALEPTPIANPDITATPVPVARRVGIVSGHRGIYPETGLPDPGAVCEDGLTEAEVNETIAQQVAAQLEAQGYSVDILDEFDSRLNGYRALAIVSIHADSCEYISESATGFKVASFADTTTPEADERLVDCMREEYEDVTGLDYHPSVTFDMTQYHTFREVSEGVPGAIIEVGFLYLDRDLLTGSPDLVAEGITRGLLCYFDDLDEGAEVTPVDAAPLDGASDAELVDEAVDAVPPNEADTPVP
jgi:N-acetylmuramoyl-L-alanine amidase